MVIQTQAQADVQASPPTERLTYEAWLELPETTQPCEIVDGVMHMAPAPLPDHQWISRTIYLLVEAFVRSRELGVVLYAPLDVVIQRDPLRTRQPDILFLSAERTGIRGRRELRQMRVIEVPPDLVIEVFSPGDTRRDLTDKVEDYRRLGVRECWIASPQAETIEVLRLSAEGMERLGLFGAGDAVRSEVLPELTLPVDELFA